MCLGFPTLRSAFAFSILLLAALAGMSPGSYAADIWPARTVRLIVPFPAGSANDSAARLYAEGLSKRWGKPVVVENRPGADGSIGTGVFANARDDHTLLYGTASTLTVNPFLQDSLPYDPARDLVPIGAGASAILVVAVYGELPVHSLQDLTNLAQAKPGQLNWGSGPSLPYFVFAALIKRRGLSMVHIPYRDAASPAADLGEGRAHVLSQSLQGVAAPVSSGKARIIAVMSPQRAPSLPDVSTVAESGFPEMEMEGLSGLFGWRDMPTELRDRLSADMQAVAQDAELRARVAASGQRVLGSTAAEFAGAIERQRARVEEIARIIDLKSGIR
jgi:tripartite-type tricarboxylate transporter receptor subunit TctC